MEKVDTEKGGDGKPYSAKRVAYFSPVFNAVSNVLTLARAGQLRQEDLLFLPRTDDIDILTSELQLNFQREVARAEAEKKAAMPGDKKPPKPPSLAMAIWPLIKNLWAAAFCCKAVAVSFIFVGPLILTESIELIADLSVCSAIEAGNGTLIQTSDPPYVSQACRDSNNIHMGYVYAGLMFLAKCIETVCESWHAHLMMRCALRARAGMISEIYRKCLWLSGMGGEDASTGKTQNLVANDAQFFLQFAPLANNLIFAPITLIVAFTWLATLIGPSFLAGLAVMILTVPLQGKMIGKYFTAQMKRLKLTDERVKLTNEMVQGMRVIKMYAWESTIKDKIQQVRAKELVEIRAQRILSAGLSIFMTTTPLLVSVVTMSVYAGSGNELRAATVLPALSLLAIMRLPLAFLPMILMQIVNLQVSLNRVKRFLLNEELPAHVKARSIAAGKSAAHVPPNGALGPDTAVLPTPSFVAACGPSLTTADDPAGVRIRGSFRWPLVEVPAGKGKGKGKGKGGGKGGGRGGGGSGGDAPAKKRSIFGGRGGRKLESSKPKMDVAAVSSSADEPKKDEPSLPSPPPSPPDEKKDAGEEADKPIGSGDGGKPGGRKARRSKELDIKKPPPPPTLHELDLTFPHSRLSMIAGAVGSGKSSLLCALLGEMNPVKPKEGSAGEDAKEGDKGAADRGEADGAEVKLDGQAGYFSQTAVILNDTLRGNILFGAPMDEERYQQTLHACALLPDLKILPGGDMTQIGEKGINLSGGQKARVSLARACYARASTLLLDDPLSAVDAHVGKHIFRHVLGPQGLLGSTTRVLVTHQTQFLPLADKVVILSDGRVAAQGTYEEVREAAKDTPAGSFLAELSDSSSDLQSLLGSDEAVGLPKARSELMVGEATKNASGSRLVMDEEKASGSVSWAIHFEYLRAAGGAGFGMVLLLGCCWERAVMVSTDYWLTLWINPYGTKLVEVDRPQGEYEFWIPIYFGFVALAGVSVYGRSLFMGVMMGLRAARVMYQQLTGAVISSPIVFFETTPSGRIINRFTSDTEQMDFQLLMMISQWINCVSSVVGALVLICIVNPWFLAALPGIAIIYSATYISAAPAMRELQRLEALSKSPIYTQFAETLVSTAAPRTRDLTGSEPPGIVSARTRHPPSYHPHAHMRMPASHARDPYGAEWPLDHPSVWCDRALLQPVALPGQVEHVLPLQPGPGVAVGLCTSRCLLRAHHRCDRAPSHHHHPRGRLDAYVPRRVRPEYGVCA